MVKLSFRLRPRCLTVALMAMLLSFAIAAPAVTQSSVRPPDDAVNTGQEPGLTAPLGSESDSDIWRRIKQGGAGATEGEAAVMPSVPGRPVNTFGTVLDELTAVQGGATSSSGHGRLIQTLGEDWRLIRRNYILPYTGWIFLGVVSLLALFYIVRGRIAIKEGRSGKMIYRFSMSHRIAHWFLAATFILMGLSGLIVLFGRTALVPLIGKEANAVLASAALQGHNLFGPVFILALLILIVRFMRGNFFQLVDLKWLLKAGGLLGGHASSYHYNFGEKSWYWIVVLVGLLMSATGLLLLFPWITDKLVWHQLSTILHAGGAILMICIALGHAYIGSIGMEGSLDSMLRGEVDENWAKEHHDLWYEQATGKSAGHDGDKDGAGDATAATEGAS